MLGIDQRPVTFDGMIVPPVAHEVKTISIGYFLDDEGAVMWRGPMLHRALEQFLTDVHWGGARLPADRHAAGHRRHRDLARPAVHGGRPPGRVDHRDDAATRPRSASPSGPPRSRTA